MYFSNGMSGSIAPYLNCVCEKRILPATPALAYWSTERRGSWPLEGSRPLLLSAGLESSLIPSIARVSTPKPSAPSV
ncbi:hypothetical protein G039_0303635 [Pseudomonas aeruginosa VRFPA01]|nr:hypothetical protein G039_0303635 [Pseudomonas aeruginosa VRFPA01]